MSLDWSLLLPSWLLIVISFGTFFFCLWALITRTRGQLIKSFAFVILLMFLAGPGIRQARYQPQPQDALIVVDHTASMNIRDRRDIADKAADNLAQQASQIAGVSTYRLDVNDDNQQGTHLFEAIKEEAQNHPNLSAIFLLTDGMNHDTPQKLDNILPGFKGRFLPVHLLLTAKGEEKDRALQLLSTPPYAIMGTEAHIHIRVNDLGGKTGQSVKIYKRQNSAKPKFIADTLTGQTIDIPVKITQNGSNLIELSASKLPDEASTRNNRLVVSIQGIQDHLKVMLVSGAPNQSARVWRDLLKADPSVDLVHFTILRSPETSDDTPISDLALIPFPTHELFVEKTNQFDLIILDSFDNPNILPESYIDNITRYVRQGGGLLVVSGSELAEPGSLQDTSLGEVLPARVTYKGAETGVFKPVISPFGQNHPVTNHLSQKGPWGDEWGPWYRLLKTTQIKGKVLLATKEGTPLLAIRHDDKGRVAQILSDQIWLWSRGGSGGGPQKELLRRLSHWLMKEPDLEGERLKARLDDHKIIVDRYSLTPHDFLMADISSPLGEHFQVKMQPVSDDSNHLKGSLTLTSDEEDNQGIWTIRQNGLATFIADTALQTIEMQDLRSTAHKLEPLVEKSGGGIFWIGDHKVPTLRQVAEGHKAFGTDWTGLPLHREKIMGADHLRSILPSWLALILILPLLALSWWREGH
ncbi:DUF7408 domain-containing protein [Aristophania vespae]|uniref:DUF7408 domain-containing protein n=1 Tax=Aristophania vespae TaxID=2697033 RepID=UPI002351B4A9|nr:VWA domain-containing protein [Aristophania vespae]UMM63600.1 hypothetical protein DM15PD_05740 [Aristophania vespae]